MWRREPPVGVVLAGGLGRRIGGSKATVQLNGRPLISYPVEAVRAALGSVAVIAKPDTELPNLPGVAVWIEPPGRHHPLVGIVQALGLAGGRDVLICAADLPFVTPALIRRLARVDPQGALAVLATHGQNLQPLLGCYRQGAAARLSASDGDQPLRDAVAALHPRLFEVGDPQLLFNVNAPDDLLLASALLANRR